MLLKDTLCCLYCNKNHPACLQFHHRDPEIKAFGISEAVHNGIGLDKLKKEIAKCDVLCANCHAKLHFEYSKGKRDSRKEGLLAEFEAIKAKLFPTQEETSPEEL